MHMSVEKYSVVIKSISWSDHTTAKFHFLFHQHDHHKLHN